MKKNAGKIFEESFARSCPDHLLVKRLNDNAASFSGGGGTRFSSSNECDFLLFDDKTRTFYGLELKSTEGTSLTFWRSDFDDPNKKRTFDIRRCQIEGLNRWSTHKGVFGFLINFRAKGNRTFFVSIIDFIKYTSKLNKKSINLDDVLKMNPIEIENQIIRTRYKYNIEKFLKDTAILT